MRGFAIDLNRVRVGGMCRLNNVLCLSENGVSFACRMVVERNHTSSSIFILFQFLS